MKNIKIDDMSYQMLQKISPRRDAIGVSATIVGMIRDAYDSKK